MLIYQFTMSPHPVLQNELLIRQIMIFLGPTHAFLYSQVCVMWRRVWRQLYNNTVTISRPILGSINRRFTKWDWRLVGVPMLNLESVNRQSRQCQVQLYGNWVECDGRAHVCNNVWRNVQRNVFHSGVVVHPRRCAHFNQGTTLAIHGNAQRLAVFAPQVLVPKTFEISIVFRQPLGVKVAEEHFLDTLDASRTALQHPRLEGTSLQLEERPVYESGVDASRMFQEVQALQGLAHLEAAVASARTAAVVIKTDRVLSRADLRELVEQVTEFLPPKSRNTQRHILSCTIQATCFTPQPQKCTLGAPVSPEEAIRRPLPSKFYHMHPAWRALHTLMEIPFITRKEQDRWYKKFSRDLILRLPDTREKAMAHLSFLPMEQLRLTHRKHPYDAWLDAKILISESLETFKYRGERVFPAACETLLKTQISLVALTVQESDAFLIVRSFFVDRLRDWKVY